MNTSSPYDKYSSRNKRINIPLENFRFFHQPSSDEEVDPKYISRQNAEHQLKNWLEEEKTNHGVYLVTGYRGMGKSSLVGKVLNDLKGKPYYVLKVNLGQENINEKEILRIIAKMLYEKTCEKLQSTSRFCSTWFCGILSSLIALFFIISSNWNDIQYKLSLLFDRNSNINWITFILTFITIWAIIYSLTCLLNFIIQKNTQGNKIKEALKKLKNLCTRLNATVSYENGYKLSFKGGGISHKQSQNLESASVQEIEYELIQFLKTMKECRENDKFVIVLDELDKTEPPGHDGNTGMDIPDYGKVESKPDRHVTSRERRQEVLRIIANMKFFLTTAQAYFIFIAGRELYEAFQADMSDRDFTISSIFTNVLNIDSFLTSSRNANNTALMTEQFICKQLFPKGIKEIIENKHRESRYDKNNPYCLKNYYYYCLEKDKENKEPSQKDTIWRDVLFLYHFTHYLTYISNGSPKKMSMFFEKNVRSDKYLEENGKTGGDTNIPEGFYLSFGYYTQQKINFIHYLTYPVMQSVINMSNMYGDKLLVSASFLISHIYKFHNNGFSWRNIEQTPELQEINKTPEIREFISSVIDYLNHTHLTTIVCGLYHYKFPMRITEEISFFSKVSNEVSSLFNFSLDQSKALKEHYMNLLAYYRTQNNSPSLYQQESIHHSLGDVYMMEENYSKAIGEYKTCVDLVMTGKNTMEHSLNDVLFATRTMLKLGLAHEKRKTDNSAFIVYESLINYLKEIQKNKTNSILFEDIRIMHLAILAKLYVLEKLDTDGIKDYHIKRAIDDFNELMQTGTYFPFYMNISQISAIVQADFYRKLGDILYYKNSKFSTNPDLKIKSAYEAYIESLKTLNISGQVESLFEQSFKETDKNNSTNKRDNFLYNIGLVCESLGHVSYSDYEEHENQGVYHKDFFEKLINKLKTKSEDIIEAKNNLERSILYYLAASRYYNASCERNLSSQCYIEIILALSSYMPTIKEKKEVPGKEFRDFLDLMVHFLLICRHRQYEHIHLSEINTLKWMQGREMYEYIELCDLSIAPDIEEIVYAYYTIKLDLAILYGKEKNADAEKERNSLVKFYKSRLMTGKITCSTLTSSILNQRLKARFNEFLLSKLLDIEEDKLKDATLEDLMLFQERNIFESPWIKDLFQEEKEKEKYENRFDVLEFLISDGNFCLSSILEKIIPLRNTTLFNNSFKGDIYYHLIRFTHLYKLLYCYYSYNNASNQDKINLYLSNCRIKGEEFPEGQLIATIKQETNNGNDGNTINVYSVNQPSDVEKRRNNFLKKMTYATKRTNPSKTIKVYLAENAIYYYTQAWQVHNQGKSYQLMIRNLHFLDDDLNNNTCQFYMTIERLLIKNKTIQDRIIELKELYKDSYYYKADSYFIEEE